MQYRLCSNGKSKVAFFDTEVKVIDYDDVVDRSQFRPDSENIRNKTLSNLGAGAMNGVYDDDPDSVTDEEVAIRSGKLDRTEIQRIIDNKVKEYSDENIENAKKKEADRLKKLNDARQDYLDAKTGFMGLPQEN